MPRPLRQARDGKFRVPSISPTLQDDRWTISSSFIAFFLRLSFFFLPLAGLLASLFLPLTPPDSATLSSTTREVDRVLFDCVQAGSCREHQESLSGNGSCSFDRDKGARYRCSSGQSVSISFFSTTVLQSMNVVRRLIEIPDRKECYRTTRVQRKSNERAAGLAPVITGSVFLYDVEVAPLVSEKRTVCRMQGGPVMSLERELASLKTDNLWMSIICVYENISRSLFRYYRYMFSGSYEMYLIIRNMK